MKTIDTIVTLITTNAINTMRQLAESTPPTSAKKASSHYQSELQICAPSHNMYRSLLGATGGMVTCIRKACIVEFLDHVVIRPGFGTCSFFRSSSDLICIANIHVHPHWNAQCRKEFFLDVAKAVAEYPSCVVFLLGDFNQVCEGEHRLNIGTGKFTKESDAHIKAFSPFYIVIALFVDPVIALLTVSM